MDTKQPEAMRIAHTALQVRKKDVPDDVYAALGDCAWALRNLHAENERLRTSRSDARHEIANLQERVQELGRMARDVNSRRAVELEAQLAAVSADGMRTLMLAPAQDDSLTAAYMAGAHDAEKAARKRLEGKP